MKIESLLVDCCVVESPSKQLPWFSSSVKKLLSYFLCQPIFAVNSWNRQKTTLHQWPWLPPLYWLIVACFELHWERWHKMVSKNWWNSKNSHCFYTKIHSLPLTFSENQGSERPELTESKWPCFSCHASKFGDSCTPWIRVKMGVFLKEVVSVQSEGRGT